MQNPAFAQLTIRSILLGIILAMILAGANAYLGLFAGMTVSASIPAAVISMAVLKLFRRSNILENNAVQTAASAGESLAAGAIFTLPALVLMNYWQAFDYAWVSAIVGLGGLLGVMFSIPLRRAFIVEHPLQYPEGVATVEVLKSGHADNNQSVRYLLLGGALAALMKFCETGLRLWSASAEVARQAGNSIFVVGTNVSPALLGVGFIVGPNVAWVVFAGGVLAWWLVIPGYMALFAETDPLLTQLLASDKSLTSIAGAIWSAKIRYLGVGAMLVGGVWTLLATRRSLFLGIQSGLQQWRGGGGKTLADTERDLPMPLILLMIAASIVPLFFIYETVLGTATAALPTALIMLLCGFLFAAVAGYMAGIMGSSHNPVSGVTIATILFTSVLLTWLSNSSVGPAAAILVGGVVCCAAAISGDNLQDLKAGYLLQATPWKQQVMQIIGVVSATLVMAPILNLLMQAYGFGAATPEQPNALAAPQANLMASVAKGVFGEGDIPWHLVALGCGLAVVVIIADEWLQKRQAGWRIPVLALAVGIYLPLELSVPIAAGGLIAWLVRRTSIDANGSNKLLLAAGLITGEALVGILLALPIVLSGQPDILAVSQAVYGGLPGLVLLVFVGLLFFKRDTQNSG